MNAVLQKMDKLPPELRAIIESDEIISIIDEICDSFDIPYTWRSELVRATVRIMSGLMSPVEFIPFIMNEYFLEKEDALQIALLINERIFSAVKPQLASLHNIEDAKLAHKIKVPHKPIYEEISEAFESPSEIYTTPTVTYTPAPVIKNETPTPYVSQPMVKPVTKMPESILENKSEVNTEQVKDTPMADTAPLSSSALVNKLNNMRADPYREKY